MFICSVILEIGSSIFKSQIYKSFIILSGILSFQFSLKTMLYKQMS